MLNEYIMNKKTRNTAWLTITLPLYLALILWVVLRFTYGDSTSLFVATIGLGICYYFWMASRFKKKLQNLYPKTEDYIKAIDYYRKWHILC